MGRQQRSKPSFFKVLINQDFAKQLRLPTDFVRQHGEILRENVVLRARSGESWGVKLEHIDQEFERCYFTLGWPELAEDLSLRMGEFLVFWYAGKSTFDFSVFGISGCERNISKCKSEFVEISSGSDDVQARSWAEDNAFTGHENHREMSNKRARSSVYENEATRGKVDRLSPLYFEIVLKNHHRSRMTLPVAFANMSGLIRQKSVMLEYVPKQHFTCAKLHLIGHSRLDMGSHRFIKENGLIFGGSYSFEFNPKTKVIWVDDIK